jgi:NAD(P)H dehydrogenase (quinone)
VGYNKVLIVYSHPSKESFNYHILKSLKELLDKNSINYNVRDLYEINFDPILRFDSLNDSEKESILVEQEYIRNSDLIIFIYPCWWGSMPAILKGYIDKVFSYGFAYKQEGEEVIPLLEDKSTIIISTFGGKENIYKQYSLETSIKKINEAIIFNFCGIKVLEQFFIYQVNNNNKENILSKLTEVLSKINKIINQA